MTHEMKPWEPPAEWGEWVSILLAARSLGVPRYTIDLAPIRSARVGHRTVIVNVADLVGWVNASLRSRCSQPAELADEVAEQVDPPPAHRRYGAVVPTEQVAS